MMSTSDDHTNSDAVEMCLLELLDELLELIARHVYHAHLPSSLNMLQTCRTVHDKLARWLRTAAAARRLQWVQDVRGLDAIDKRVLHRPDDGRNVVQSFAVSTPLPTEGQTSVELCIEQCYDKSGNLGVGVCDAACRHAWVLRLYDGMLWRVTEPSENVADGPPEGFPDYHLTQLMKTDGEPDSLEGRADGAVVKVMMDHDKGVLSFAIGDGPTISEELKGFPPRAALRIAAMIFRRKDQIRILTPWL